MNKYLKFEYWNTCDLGNIYYQGGQKFMFYLDADVGEPLHEDIEEGQENGDGDFIPTYRRQMKRYRIRTGLIPDFLIDAMQRMKLHDNIELTFKTGEVEQIYNVDIEPEWQFEKYAWQGTVTMTFDMNESITVGACCDNLVVDDIEPIPEYYWVAENGSDLTGNGSYANPWATLAYACTQAVVSGDVIHVKAGAITETAQIVKPLGVSIMGAGQGITVINSTYVHASSVQAAMQCASTAGSTVDDNSTLSHFTFTGSNRTSQRGIYVGYRNNVIIHHVTLEDFNRSGIYFDSQVPYPDLYITGCKVYSCIINDCSLRDNDYPGSLRMRGTDGLEVYDCVFDNTGRPNGQNGQTIAPWRSKRLDFHDNVLYRNDHETTEAGVEKWNFFWEEWDYHGDSRVYNNTFYGLAQFSLGGYNNAIDEDCTFGYLVEGNRFLNVANGNRTVNGNTRTIFGICVEGHNHKKVTITRNLLERFGYGIELSHPSSEPYDRNWHWEDIIVSYNVLIECGYEDFAYGSAMWIIHEADPPGYTSTFENISFLNNTITSKKGTYTGYCGFLFNMHGTVTGLSVKNNIVDGFANDAVRIIGTDGDTLTIIGLDVIHNNFYDNGTDAVDIESDPNVDVTNSDITTGNITGDPLFVSATDFHLQAGSPCINAGVYVGLTTDYDNQTVSSPPEIGAYEYYE